MAARVYCTALLCLSGCWSSTEAAPGPNFTAVNPGVCPSRTYEPEVCALIRFVSCDDDRDCAKNNQKCCNNGCGLQCMAPVKPGVCPKTNSELVKCMKVEDLCVDDNECPKNEKCCNTACDGRQCTAPVPVKPGVCPKTNLGEIMCFRKDDDLCVDDNECPKNQKCCSTACGGHQCTAPVTVKPGVCPKTKAEVIRCSRKDDDLCVDDNECPKNEKCCSTSCGGHRCTAPVTVKPGVCPKTKAEVIRCSRKDDDLCVDDNECPKNQKCCSTSCGGHRCTAPVTVKPGVCPSTKYEGVICKKAGLVLCADDSKCPKKEKCCSTACGGRECMAPVTVKPGVCPKKKYDLKACPKIYFPLCADDSECPNNDKCCDNGCGLQCLAPVKG